MQFQVRTFDLASGALAEVTMEAENADDIRRQFDCDNITVLSIHAQKVNHFWNRPATFNTVLFCEELRTLLSSGMSLVEAVETLCSKNNFNSVLSDIRQRLLEGKNLSSALAQSRFRFPPLLIASLKASERSSLIGQALDEYISYEKVSQELRKKIVSAAIYPSLVVGFGVLVCLFMLSYVVPRFSRVYEDFSHTLSFSTLMLMKLGTLFENHLLLMLLMMTGLGIAFTVAWRNGKLAFITLKLLGQFKLTQHYLRLYQLARVVQTISMLLKGGYTLSDAIPLAQNLAFEDSLKGQLMAMRLSVMEGKRLSTACAENGLTDHVSERLLQVGERSGDLPKVLDIIALNYRGELNRFIENATRLIEPILLMTVGTMIGAIIIVMYMPVFDLAGGM